MLMWVAKVVDGYVQRMYDEMAALGEGGTVDMDMGIQILFLDGEEAFHTWTDTDSLYGARYVLTTLRVAEIRKLICEQESCDPMGGCKESAVKQILPVSDASIANKSVHASRPPRLRLPNRPFLLPYYTLGIQTPLDRRDAVARSQAP